MELEYEIKKVSLAPGDILVLKIDMVISQDLAKRIRDDVERVIGKGWPVLVIDRSFQLSVVNKTDAIGIDVASQ